MSQPSKSALESNQDLPKSPGIAQGTKAVREWHLFMAEINVSCVVDVSSGSWCSRHECESLQSRLGTSAWNLEKWSKRTHTLIGSTKYPFVEKNTFIFSTTSLVTGCCQEKLGWHKIGTSPVAGRHCRVLRALPLGLLRLQWICPGSIKHVSMVVSLWHRNT